MTPGSLLLFALVYFAAVASPGPGIAALAANRARALLRSARAMRLVGRAAGALMAGVAVAVAAS